LEEITSETTGRALNHEGFSREEGHENLQKLASGCLKETESRIDSGEAMFYDWEKAKGFNL
jgi:hypothetical protein